MELLHWYDQQKRDLAFRGHDAWGVLVSELMLQQTRVATMQPYFVRFMATFPTPHAMAAADEDVVMQAWSGLGYYRRARYLHAAAKQIAAHGWPDDLQSLPGVGPYTAGAVGSIAFGKVIAAVDGNVERVLARWHQLGPLTPSTRRIVATLASSLVDSHRPGDWNQALMELGAIICTPTPRCNDCPVPCAVAGGVGDHGKKLAKKPPVHEQKHFAYWQENGKIGLVKTEDGLLSGLYGLPEIEPRGEPIATVRHVFTHRVWHMHVYHQRAATLLDPESVPLSTAAKKAIAASESTLRQPTNPQQCS